MISLIVAAAISQAQPADTTYEGKWFVIDTTNNNTGEREVSAFQMYIKRFDPDYVTVRMRCSEGRPKLFIEWADVTFPDQAVITIGAGADAEANMQPQNYLFEVSEDVVESGLRASSETSAKVIADIGQAKYVTITAHLSSGARSVGMEIDGTQRAWSRVVRHCPVQLLPRPPL